MSLFYRGLAGILIIFYFGCETDPIISIPSKPIPVVYAIFDDSDSIHQILIEKSFGAQYNPLTVANIYDSLFFDDLEVIVAFKPNFTSPWQNLPINKENGLQKDSGYFHSPQNEYYYFKLKLSNLLGKYGDSLRVQVNIPGYEEIIGQIEIIDPLIISTPKRGQQFVYLVPSTTFKVHWDHSSPGQKPHAMNEIDVQFEFIEETSQGFRSKFVKIQNTQWISAPSETYREMSITYEEFIKAILQQMTVNDSVLRTYLGYIDIHIAGADTNLVQYKKYLNGYSDYNFAGFSNIKNGFGLFTSVTHTYKDSLRFDYETRQTLINENRLKKYKLSPWME